jgi:YrbI family 3-deoxy-D-manno-octulosonate 8-phosphate phosphatase
MTLQQKTESIKLIVCDVDGTLTDAGIYLTEDGVEFKKFSAKDGLAMSRLNQNGLKVALLSHTKNVKLIQRRAEMLSLSLWYAGKEPKLQILNQWLEKEKLAFEEVCFIGDDLNDLDIMEKVGLKVCPANSCEEIVALSDIVIPRNGGQDCFRYFADMYFKKYLLMI